MADDNFEDNDSRRSRSRSKSRSRSPAERSWKRVMTRPDDNIGDNDDIRSRVRSLDNADNEDYNEVNNNEADNQETVETVEQKKKKKKKASELNIDPTKIRPDLPANLRELIDQGECKLCNSVLNSLFMVECHYNGKNHQTKLKCNGFPLGRWSLVDGYIEHKFINVEDEYDGNRNDGMSERSLLRTSVTKPAPAGPPLPPGANPNMCVLCNVTFTSMSHAAQHYFGKRHLSKMEDSGADDYFAMGLMQLNCQLEKGVVDPRKLVPPSLDLPSLSTSGKTLSEQQKAMYLNSEFKCELCKVFASCQSNLDDHFAGKAHKSRVAKLELEMQANGGDPSMINDMFTGGMGGGYPRSTGGGYGGKGRMRDGFSGDWGMYGSGGGGGVFGGMRGGRNIVGGMGSMFNQGGLLGMFERDAESSFMGFGSRGNGSNSQPRRLFPQAEPVDDFELAGRMNMQAGGSTSGVSLLEQLYRSPSGMFLNNNSGGTGQPRSLMANALGGRGPNANLAHQRYKSFLSGSMGDDDNRYAGY